MQYGSYYIQHFKLFYNKIFKINLILIYGFSYSFSNRKLGFDLKAFEHNEISPMNW